MMVSLLRLLEHTHGHVGWLSAALLVHPAIVLRHKNRRAHIAVALACAMPTLTAAMGISLYGPYRDLLKQSIFVQNPDVGWMFERKEHLAFATIALTWTATLAYFGAWKREGAAREKLQAFSHRAFVLAALLAVLVASIGTYVASYKTF